ncbi:hypothetical protein H0H81_012102 [Sphagnurus paluster]|uniref:Pentatricopeptide repeat-containing protein n=1 Tax=Sphagnurus paluster TaxID=117069 RepID=A0A9P7KM98_9AGAR|nr:hypothetical protein H0H81_012102 [Sphagnurus paluster]
MLLARTAARHNSVVLLDFLAPSLVARAASNSTRRSKVIPTPITEPFPSEVVDKVKEGLPFVHSTRGVSNGQVALLNETLVQIRQASAEKDVHLVLKLWRKLEVNRLTHFLPVSQVDVVSRLLAAAFCAGELDFSSIKLVQDVALQAAACRSTDALNDILILLLKQKDSGAVIQIYNRFMDQLGGKEVWEDNSIAEEAPQNTGLVSDDHPKYQSLSYTPGRLNLLLVVTAAYAQRNAFDGALKTCLNTVIRFHHQSTKSFLDKFSHDPAFQQKVDTYVKRLEIARLVARPPSLTRQITNLSGAPTTKPLEALYRSILSGLSGPDAYLSVDPSKITPEKSVAMTEAIWTSFLAAFLRFRRRDMASKIWTDMMDLGIRPGVSLWTALIDSYDSINAVDDAVTAWNMMSAQGIKPEALTYRALISTLFRGRKYLEGMKLFQAFQKMPAKHIPLTHILAVYNTVLNGLLSFNREDEAQALLKTMETRGPAPDLVSYNTLLAYFGRRGNFKTLADLVSRMSTMNIVGDVFSFSTILSALLRAGRNDAPELVMDIMRKQGVQPNVATYTAIIDHQIRERTEENLEAVMRILEKMEKDPNAQPNEITYTSILAGLYRGQWLEPTKVEQWRQEIIARMKKRGVEFNTTTYHILIKACLEYPRPEGLTNGLSYYQDMRHRKFTLTHTTWYLLLLGLLRRGDWAVADEIVKDMFYSGHQPTGAVKDLVGKIRRRDF